MPAPGCSPSVKDASVVVFDTAAVIHIIKPQRATVFGEYTQMQLLPYLQSQLTEKTTRVDAVWDTNVDASLKSQTRVKRGETATRRTRVSAKIPIPKGAEWQLFLKDSQNKDELFQFISQELFNYTGESHFHFFTTKSDLVLCNTLTDVTDLCPCQQEEADTRMMLHLRHAAEQGHAIAYLKTVDSDVV